MAIESDKEIHELIALRYRLESVYLYVKHNKKYGMVNYINNERKWNGNENELDYGDHDYIVDDDCDEYGSDADDEEATEIREKTN